MFIINNFANLLLWLVCQQFAKSNILHSFFFGKELKVVCYQTVQRQKNAKLVLFFKRIFQEEAQHYGIDWDGPIPISKDPDSVIVPQVTCPLDTEKLSELLTLFDVRQNSKNFGADIYLDVRSFVYRNALSGFVTKTACLIASCKTGAGEVFNTHRTFFVTPDSLIVFPLSLI